MFMFGHFGVDKINAADINRSSQDQPIGTKIGAGRHWPIAMFDIRLDDLSSARLKYCRHRGTTILISLCSEKSRDYAVSKVFYSKVILTLKYFSSEIITSCATKSRHNPIISEHNENGRRYLTFSARH